MPFQDLPIKRKVSSVIMLTSVVVLTLTAAVLIIFDSVSYRQLMLSELRNVAGIVALDARNALTSTNRAEASRILQSLQGSQNIVAAALYGAADQGIAVYGPQEPSGSLPKKPGPEDHWLRGHRLMLIRPVFEGDVQVGTLYLESEIRPLYLRLRLYIAIVLCVLAGSLAVAWGLAYALQRRITAPILALADTARAVSEQRDYSVRAPKLTGDELGGLTDAFNEMLARIQESGRIRSFLAAIVESSDAAIVGKDLNGTVVSWNKGAEHIFGYTAAEMVGQPIVRVLQHAEEEQEILRHVRAGGIRQYETVRLRCDGTPLDISLIASPIQDEQGRIVGVSSIARDITDRKRAQRALEESQARLSGIIASAMDAIISVDSRQHIRIFNSAAEKMFRCSADQALNQPLERFIPERYRAAQGQEIEQLGKNGLTAWALGQVRPLCWMRADGEEFPIEASISQIGQGGEKIYTIILRDITERQRAEQTLARQTELLRENAALLDLATVTVRDLEDRIILWHAGMEKLYGWTKAEAIGSISHDLLQTEFPEPLQVLRTKVLRDGRWEGEVKHRRKDGQMLFVASLWVLHRDRNGNPAAILEMNTDISARKQAEEQVRQLNLKLEERVEARTAELTAANRELEAFTYSVAHDLRAPLRHIDAFSKILREEFVEALPSEAKRYFENISRGSRHMSQIVDDLLNLARVSRLELKRAPVSLTQLLHEVLADLRAETEGRSIQWRLHPLPTIECDPGLMKQVFANLLSNAVKYTRPRACALIEVGCLATGGTGAIYVRDNGVGFNMKYIDKLFGVFQRLHRADDFEGTGIGLATVERIIRKHGGCVWAEGAVDKGAAFYFSIPALHDGAHLLQYDGKNGEE